MLTTWNFSNKALSKGGPVKDQDFDLDLRLGRGRLKPPLIRDALPSQCGFGELGRCSRSFVSLDPDGKLQPDPLQLVPVVKPLAGI
jgi:hypothetical protein